MKKVKPIVTRWIKPPPSTASSLLHGLPEKQVLTVEEQARVFSQVLSDMDRLLGHFEIERGDGEWFLLAHRLALEGGFINLKVRGTGPGRKAGAALRGQLALWAHVQLFLCDKPGKRPTDAMRHLRDSRKGPWSGVQLKTLQNRYDEARKNGLIEKFAPFFANRPGELRKMAEILAAP